MKTVLLIHGYNGIPKIYDYFKERLEQMSFQVVAPNFPTQEKITLSGYYKVFDNYKNVFSDKPIVVAHSIGNEMVLKYICLHNYKIDLFVSLAGFSHPFTVEGRDDLNRVLASVSMSDEEKERCVSLIKRRISFYGDNDHIVPLSVLQGFCDDIKSDGVMISGVGHMGSKSGITELPQVVDVITSSAN